MRLSVSMPSTTPGLAVHLQAPSSSLPSKHPRRKVDYPRLDKLLQHVGHERLVRRVLLHVVVAVLLALELDDKGMREAVLRSPSSAVGSVTQCRVRERVSFDVPAFPRCSCPARPPTT